MDEKKPKKPTKKELLKKIEALGYEHSATTARSSIAHMINVVRWLERDKAEAES